MSNSIDRILVVDDEQDIVEFISYTLRSKGFEVETASDGNEAIAKALYFKPNLILLDVMMPNKDGKQTLKELKLKPQFANTIVIFLTALSDEKSEIDGLNLGADDYIAKPIKMELLLTRINSALRRNSKEKVDEKQEFGDLEINRSQFTVKYQGQQIILAKKEFELLHLLASRPGRVFLRNEILSQIWGNEVIVGDRTIDVHIRKIRQKLGVDCITTVKGVGYKFDLP